jgi:probable addiction module antidote protein
MAIKAKLFEVADYLDSDETIAEYLTAAMEGNDPRHIANALADVARARGGMNQLAKDTGLSVEELTPAFDENKPDFATILRVLRAFGLQLSTTIATEEPLAA